jgi:hypothetical protein
MWISRLDCRESRRSSNEVCRHEKSTKNRKKRSTNMSRVFQASIAFACVDSPSLIQRRASLSEAAIKRCHSSMYNGDDKNGARSTTLKHSSYAGHEQVKILYHYTLVRVLQQVRLILSNIHLSRSYLLHAINTKRICFTSSVPHHRVSRFVRNRVPHKRMRTFCKSLQKHPDSQKEETFL